MSASSSCEGKPPSQAFLAMDLFDKVTKTVIADLKAGIPFFNYVLFQNGFLSQAEIDERGSKTSINDVYRGKDKRISDKMFIRVITKPQIPTWQATRVRDDKYQFQIDCCVKHNAESEVNEEELVIFGSAVKNYLLRYDNLQPIIDGTSPAIRGYNSWCDEGVEFNTEELVGTYRMATIQYYILVMNPYCGFRAEVCA